jgi:hypothetical protein
VPTLESEMCGHLRAKTQGKEDELDRGGEDRTRGLKDHIKASI